MEGLFGDGPEDAASAAAAVSGAPARDNEDPVFESFRSTISREPTQIIRYILWPQPSTTTAITAAAAAADEEEEEKGERGGEELTRKSEDGESWEPLWISSKGRLQASDVPNCERCGSGRRLEFQILPQLLNYLELDRVLGAEHFDFGTVCVYTCVKSCAIHGYANEYIYHQPLL